MRRRQLLRASLASLAAVPACAAGREREVEDGADLFPQGVASGDPRPDSVVLWARVVDPEHEGEDIELAVDISRDETFGEDVHTFDVLAEAAFDGCAKLKVTDLEPRTTYYYRFLVSRDGVYLASRVGRTKTAPAPDTDVAVRFAFVSCQDYVGRWYNAYLALLEQELDFFVHLGDYVYETTGDPDFQDPSSGRRVELGRPEEAIVLDEGLATEHLAASSLDNYRDLYRTYRSDPVLQRVHERLPMIATWDDHEFSDDCHGATATYLGGREDETDVERRQHANQAWFEYMPVDYEAGEDFRYDPEVAWPQDLRIWRDFVFGRHLHLVMTDARTFRSDHVVAEDAFPGAVAVDEATLIDELGEVPEAADAYVDIGAYQGGAYRDELVRAAETLGFDPGRVAGNTSVRWVNDVLAEIGSALAPIDPAGLPRGLAFIDMGKTGYYGSVGARHLVIKPAFDAYSRVRWQQSGGESEQVLGPEQEEWFFAVLEGSDRTFKVWGNEYALSQIAVDLRTLAIPDDFRQLWYLSLDLWDGHRNRRNAVIERLAGVENVVAITGDIHGFHAATPMSDGDPEKKLIELVTSSISSATFSEELDAVVDSNPALKDFPEAKQLVELVDDLLNSAALGTNPHLPWSDSTRHGFVLVDVDGERLEATYTLLEPAYVREDYEGRVDELLAATTTERFRVHAGERELYRRIDGAWKRWNPTTLDWE